MTFGNPLPTAVLNKTSSRAKIRVPHPERARPREGWECIVWTGGPIPNIATTPGKRVGLYLTSPTKSGAPYLDSEM